MKPYRTLTAVFTAALLCVLMAPAYVLAATTKDPYGENTPLNLPSSSPVKTADVGGGTSGGLARTFVGLAVVVAVIYGLTWVLRQMKKSSSGERSTGFGLSTEASMPLGPNRSVHLIRAGRELVLVGSAEHGIVPIRTYTEDEARDLGLLGGGDDIDGDATAIVPSGPTGKAKLLFSYTLDRLRDRTAR